MNTLPPEFQYTQANLQDYTDCPRRFQLRYLLELAWPAAEVEPAGDFETLIREGEAFHRMIQQHTLGILPAELELEPESNLALWWQNYRTRPPPDLPPLRHAEVGLSAPLGEHRLVAKLDLVAVDAGGVVRPPAEVRPEGRIVIVDWKTSAKRPKPGWLAGRLQTRVYRYLAVVTHLTPPTPLSYRPNDADRRGGSQAESQPPLPSPEQRRVLLRSGAGGEADPAQVEMLYWFANHPDDPERLRYDAVQFAADGRYLRQLAAEISGRLAEISGRMAEINGRAAEDGPRDEEVWPLTGDVKRCLFCAYRSLCGRGVEAGDLAEAEDGAAELDAATDWAEGFDFEQVGEVAF